MIHEEICTYEVCKLAKEKGFPQDECGVNIGYYAFDGLRNIHLLVNSFAWYDDEYKHENLYLAPTQSLLQRWLREEKNIVVVVDWFSIERKYYCSVFDTTKDDMFASFIPPAKSMSRCDTWEQALESGLKYALKELK